MEFITLADIKTYFENAIPQKRAKFQKISEKDLIAYIEHVESIYKRLPFDFKGYDFDYYNNESSFQDFDDYELTNEEKLNIFFNDTVNAQFKSNMQTAIYNTVLHTAFNYDQIEQDIKIKYSGITAQTDDGLDETYANIQEWAILIGYEAKYILNEFLPLATTSKMYVI